MRTMSPLQDQQARLLDSARAVGVPDEYLRTVLDVDFFRRRVAEFGGRGSEAASEKVYTRIARAGATGRHWSQSALFWSLGIWRHDATATFPSDPLQPPKIRYAGYALHPEFAPAENAYRAMAARACRCSGLFSRICEIRREVLHEVRRGRRRPGIVLPPEASAWIAWFMAACGTDFEGTSGEDYSDLNDRDRWEALATSALLRLGVQISLPMVRRSPRASENEVGLRIGPDGGRFDPASLAGSRIEEGEHAGAVVLGYGDPEASQDLGLDSTYVVRLVIRGA